MRYFNTTTLVVWILDLEKVDRWDQIRSYSNCIRIMITHTYYIMYELVCYLICRFRSDGRE